MKNKDNIQRPGLRRKKFGSKAFLRNVKKKINKISKPKKIGIH
ncbi:hypothetical protein SAMN04487910_3679 [Aquimarina amphilecti]|uniref:Uncharacterized protein n=1 Tax=Aquimarina amphilecti TaxID=1038014 RepID=A0A1H7UD68_AQUAM|nr:hypothetical protein SAMN04487910_3679 [Aquimarina amphilecti]